MLKKDRTGPKMGFRWPEGWKKVIKMDKIGLQSRLGGFLLNFGGPAARPNSARPGRPPSAGRLTSLKTSKFGKFFFQLLLIKNELGIVIMSTVNTFL